mgnify:CR=1 FL=1
MVVISSGIKHRLRQELVTDILPSMSEIEFGRLFEDMIIILQGQEPQWRIERDPSIRGYHISMSSWLDEDLND